MNKRKAIFSSVLLSISICLAAGVVSGQTDGTSDVGKGKTDSNTQKPKNSNSKPKGTTPKSNKPPAPDRNSKNPPTSNRPAPGRPAAETDCAESTLAVSCGLPDCLVSVDGKTEGVTGVTGSLEIPLTGGRQRKITVSKNGYEPPPPKSVSVPCGELVLVPLTLKPKPFTWRIKTSLPNSEIYINDPPQLIGKSDDFGVFEGRSESNMIFVQAKMTGYLTESVTITPETARKEIVLKFKPMPARITLITNVPDATAQIEGNEKVYNVAEIISVEPGTNRITVRALGFAPVKLDLDLKPNQKIEKTVNLELLPVAELLGLAEKSFGAEAYPDTIRLCQYIIRKEPGNAPANRLLGMLYLEKKDFLEAEPYLLKALEGNETIILKIRRHYNEKFDLNSGHGANCEGELRLTRNEFEFRGFAAPAENFRVAYSQVQIIGPVLRKNAALSLGVKVSDAKGNRKDYNFFSRDNELTQTGKIYLNLIQGLIQRGKKQATP